MKRYFRSVKNKIHLKLITFLNRFRPGNKIFEEIYFKNGWGDRESVSGTGSTLQQTKEVIRFLPVILKEHNIGQMLDIPCGDFNWMKEIDLGDCKYLGADIVNGLITSNIKKYSDDQKSFFEADLTISKLPKVDLILCRDCFVHLSYNDIFRALENIRRSGAKYLLTTTFSGHTNRNIVTGDWRPVNLNIAPFNFPASIKLFSEKCTESEAQYTDKALGLWRIKDIPVIV